MGCFCRLTMAPLAAQLEKLSQGTPPEDTPVAEPTAAQQQAANKVAAVSNWLAARGLPAAPWRPDPAWRQVQLPTPKMTPGALATISGLLHLRAQALSQAGTDLLDPGQAEAFRRVIATMNQRLRQAPPPDVDTQQFTSLAQQNDDADQVAEALKSGLLEPSPENDGLYNSPAGVPMRDWGGLLRPLRQLAPLIAAVRHLGADEEDPEPLADALRKLARVKLPKLEQPERLRQLVRALSARQRLQDSLGDALLQKGPAAMLQKIQQKQAALAQALGEETPEQVVRKLPRRAVTPTTLATPAVVQAAQRMQKLAAVTWKVPENLPLVDEGLAACHAIGQIARALASSPIRPAPCGSQCDAAALLRAANAATGQGAADGG